MKAVVIREPGPPTVLEVRQVDDPVPGPREITVAVRATALNRADLLQRRGLYPAPPGAPADVPGLEFAGLVDACGPGASRFRPGDRVMGILAGGGHAERVSTHELAVLPVPPDWSWELAAAVPEAFLCGFDALFEQAALERGECLLQPAAGSGVGVASAQLARAAGARVVGLARSAGKRERLDALGLGPVIDPAAPDLAARVREASSGGVDVVLDLVGGPAFGLYLDVIKERGRIVVIGLLGGARAEIDLSVLLRGRLRVWGSTLRHRPLAEKIALVERFERRALGWLADGSIRPVVDRCYPLERAAEAHERMEANANLGKIVLVVGTR